MNIQMKGETGGKRNTTKHRIAFATHGTFHSFKAQSPEGGWVKRSHSVGDCTDECAEVFNDSGAFLNLTASLLHGMAQQV